MNKNIRNKYGVKCNVPAKDVINHAGGSAYSIVDEELVLQMLLTGSSADLFYTSAEENIDEAVSAFMNENVSPEFLAKALVFARQEGYNREFPIMGLVALSVRDPALFKKVCTKVLNNPHDWEMFIDICMSGKMRKGVGRAIKSVMTENLINMPKYQALKYPTAVSDMINVCRPDPNKAHIAYYIKNGGKWLDFVNSMENADEILSDMDIFTAYSRANMISESIRKGEMNESAYEMIADAIIQHKLPYEVMTSVIGKNKQCWNSLYKVAPYMNMVRNLNNFIKYGAINDNNVLEAAQRISDPKSVGNSKMFPFRFYTAWKNIDTQNEITSSSLNVLRHALEKAMELSVKNVPTLNGNTVIATDVSGSMGSPVTNNQTDIKCSEIAGIFSAILKKNNPNTMMLPFDYDIVWDIAHKYKNNMTIVEAANLFTPGGGTCLAAPMAFMTTQKMKVDTFVGITDNMEWLSKNSYGWVGNDNKGFFIDHLKKYMQTVNPNIQVYLMTLMPYNMKPVPSGIPNVHMIYGWSDVVLKYIGTNKTDQTRSVKDISL